MTLRWRYVAEKVHDLHSILGDVCEESRPILSPLWRRGRFPESRYAFPFLIHRLRRLEQLLELLDRRRTSLGKTPPRPHRAGVKCDGVK